MFYIHDIDGLQFKGPLEALEQNRRVEKSRPVSPLKNGGQFPETADRSQNEAITAYQKMIRQDNMVEPLVHIYQIMSSPVSTISLDVSLVEAWQKLKEENIRQLIVTTEKKRIIGILADKDILKRINVIDNTIIMDQDTSVGDIIPGEVVTTDSISDIRRVAKVMADYHINAMPVLENEQLVGIVTRGDILRGFSENPKLNLWA